jgi:peptidoglycan/LPS O-acetylase OafA/YrhL
MVRDAMTIKLGRCLKMSLPENPTSRLPSLTGLRFWAAAMVFIFHIAVTFIFANQAIGYGFLFFVSGMGSLGVSFFFVLSGFVLAWSLRKSDTVTRFWRRRFFKIVPNHVVTFAAALVLMTLAGQFINMPETIFNLFLVQSWFPDWAYLETANGVSWTLSGELFFYLSFPLLIGLVSRIRPGALWWTAGAIVAVIFALPSISLSLLPSEPVWPWGPASWAQIWLVNILPASRLLEFILGIVMAQIVLRGKWFRFPLPAALVLVVVGYAALLFVPVHFLYDYSAMMIIPIALLIPTVATADASNRKTIFSGRTTVFLGEISFAFYLVHMLVIRYSHFAFGGSVTDNVLSGPQWSVPWAIAFTLGSFAVSVLLAWALYAFVERPMMRRFANPRPKPAAAPVNAPFSSITATTATEATGAAEPDVDRVPAGR